VRYREFEPLSAYQGFSRVARLMRPFLLVKRAMSAPLFLERVPICQLSLDGDADRVEGDKKSCGEVKY
jgi:hypothetical protein